PGAAGPQLPGLGAAAAAPAVHQQSQNQYPAAGRLRQSLCRCRAGRGPPGPPRAGLQPTAGPAVSIGRGASGPGAHSGGLSGLPRAAQPAATAGQRHFSARRLATRRAVRHQHRGRWHAA
nr:hypothetical protein [Tanacetum cinerariifolium]